MSDGAGGDETPLPNGPIARSKSKRSSDDDENDVDDSTNQPDLGLGSQPQTNKKTANENQAGLIEAPRREENPFSFKHFLSRETANGAGSSHNTGARPKVYTSPTASHPPDLDFSRNSSTRNFAANPDLASALPDFVQDHLVVEQCFLRDGASSTLSVDLDNLPDFAISKDTSSSISGNSRPRHSNHSSFGRRREHNQNNGIDGIPLDLPSASSPRDVSAPGVLPFDLPLVRDVNTASATGNSSPSGSPVQPTVSKSLPDFLSDGPIRGGHLPPADVTAGASGVSQNHTSDDMFQTENERLRAEMEMLRRQNSELSRRVQSLQSDVRNLRAKEHEDTLTMEKALEQAEENLQRTMKRAVNAENLVSKLKHDLKQTQCELRRAQHENWGASGACGGAASSGSVDHQIQMQRYAQELKMAASTAESSLRQLLSGVDNLRLLASTMENVHRVEDRTGDYVSDSDDASGPTL